jgi:hypothetical protein
MEEYVLKIVPVAGCVMAGGQALMQEHWEEAGVHKETLIPDPDWEKIFALEKMGMWKTIELRKGEALVGYSNWMINSMLDYKTKILAQNMNLFLSKGQRLGTAGIRLINGTESLLKELGVCRCCYGIRPFIKIGAKARPLGELFSALGYQHTDEIYSKILE